MKELDPIIHSQLRLAILSILAGVDEADFMYLKEHTDATMGNLSVQLTKLQEAGYIVIEKSFHNRRPRTICRMTDTGKEAFVDYVEVLRTYIEPAIGLKTDASKPLDRPDLLPA